MPFNVDPETGIAYGVISASRVPDLYDDITRHGTDETAVAKERELREGIQYALARIDANEVFAACDSPDEQESALRVRFSAVLSRPLELPTYQRAQLVESIWDLVDVASGTFDIDEVTDAIIDWLNLNGPDMDDAGEHEYTYEDREFKYLLGYLGGAPLIWVARSPFVTYCAPCSPCVPNAGDLDSCSENEVGTLAYCLDLDDYGNDEDKPYRVVRHATNEVVYERT